MGPGQRDGQRAGELTGMAGIDRVDVYLCMADVEPRGPSSGWYYTRESVLVRLGDADGRSGW